MANRHPRSESGIRSQIRLWLEMEIANGRIRPGDRIEEKNLCDHFNASRTPVREAMLQLASTNLIRYEGGRGAVVTKMSTKEIIDVWHALWAMEGLCAEMAARRMSPKMKEDMERIHAGTAQMVSGLNVDEYAKANEKLHELIYAGAHNQYISQRVLEIRRQLQPYTKSPYRRAGGIERSREGHAKVVAAILKGDEAEASMAMRDHVAGGLAFLDFMAELEWQDEPGAATSI